jgi:signal transduction histidine kinase
VMRLRGLGDPALARARDIIDHQVQSLARLVDDLLDISRISRGKVELRRERVDLSAVATMAVETSRPLIDRRGHRLTVELCNEPLPLDADPIRLRQVITNLLNNAAKYTDPGGQVELRAGREGDRAVIRVRDNGVGIPPEMLPRIFELFTQVEGSRERSDGGLGIGLALVKRLVELHGGTVTASSAGPGQGSEFTVRLPALPEAPPDPAPPAP